MYIGLADVATFYSMFSFVIWFFIWKFDQLQLNNKHHTSDQNFRLNIVFIKTDFYIFISIFHMFYYDTAKSVIIINVKLKDYRFCVLSNFWLIWIELTIFPTCIIDIIYILINITGWFTIY